ncbi:MAG: hypothetical protein OEQ25_09490 [Gammaproteobacteria bacterium]|nr:hypothetical protein [Gammaproteobacteria bacterium]
MQHDASPGSFTTALSGRVLTAVLMFGIFVTMTLMALGFPEKARLMPLLAGVPGSVLAFIAVLQEFRKVGVDNEPDESARGNERQMLVWMMRYFLGILAFGFLYAGPVLVLAFLRFAKREPLAIAAAGAAGTWGVLYGLFELTFQIPLFDGLVLEWLAA